MADGGTTCLAIVARDNLPLRGALHGIAKYHDESHLERYCTIVLLAHLNQGQTLDM